MSEKTGATPVFEGPESAAELLARVRKRLAAAPPAPVEARLPVDPEFDLSRSEGLLDGWYEPDLWGERMTRWVARRFDFEAEVGSATHVAIDALLFDTSGLAQLRGRIRANDVVGAAFRAMPGWNAIRVPIPAGVSGRVHFSIDAGGSWNPITAGVQEDDPRELSLLVGRLALIPLADLPRRPHQPWAPPPFPGIPSARLTPIGGPADPPATFAGAAAQRELRRFLGAIRRRLLGWEWTNRVSRLEDENRELRRWIASTSARRDAELQKWQESIESWMNHFQRSVIDGLGEIASRIGREEDRGNVEANLVEDALTRLARVDAEALEDALHREDDWRDELETKLRRFLDT